MRSVPYSRNWIWLSAFHSASLPRIATNGRLRRTAVSNSAMMEADRAVAEHGEDRRLRLAQPRRDRERERAADRAGDAVDHAAPHRKHALAPLGELAAVADQHRVGIALDIRAQRAKHFRRMQAARRLRRDAWPRRRGGCRARRALRASQPPSRGFACAARAISVSAAARTSAMLPSASRPSISCAARSTSAASGSIAITRTCGSKPLPRRPARREVERLAEQHDQVGAARRDRRTRRASHPRCRAGFPE